MSVASGARDKRSWVIGHFMGLAETHLHSGGQIRHVWRCSGSTFIVSLYYLFFIALLQALYYDCLAEIQTVSILLLQSLFRFHQTWGRGGTTVFNL